ncbi:MAG: hypothetical protein Q7R78_02405 [bacterium]|nr:hypothetical protein [bacterium]
MEHLNKQQIVLVTLLVAFITAITTGIVMVSLNNQQEQPGVVNTVNRVVERTIERVISPATSTPIIKQTENRTVYVTLEEQAVKAVENGIKSLVRVYATVDTTSSRLSASALAAAQSTYIYVGSGILLDDKGTVMMNKSELLYNYSTNYNYFAVYREVKDQKVPLKTIKNDNTSGVLNDLTFFTPDTTSSIVKIDTKSLVFNSSLGNSDNLKTAQGIFTISGKDNDIVHQGIVQSLEKEKVGTTTAEKVNKINISVNPSNTSLGAMLINTSGDIIGFKTSSVVSDTQNSFIPINIVKNILSDLTK